MYQLLMGWNIPRNEQDKTLNALYAINPERNDGLDYQFENVERNKEKRKRLDAGDCECCREVRWL